MWPIANMNQSAGSRAAYFTNEEKTIMFEGQLTKQIVIRL